MAPDEGLLREHPPQSVTQRRRIVTAFLEKFARPDQVEQEIALLRAGPTIWSRTLTHAYLQDVERIKRLPGVTLIEA